MWFSYAQWSLNWADSMGLHIPLFLLGGVIFLPKEFFNSFKSCCVYEVGILTYSLSARSKDCNLGLSLSSEAGAALWDWALQSSDLTPPPGNLSELNSFKYIQLLSISELMAWCVWKTLTYVVSLVKCWVCEHKHRKIAFGFPNLWWNPNITTLSQFWKDQSRLCPTVLFLSCSHKFTKVKKKTAETIGKPTKQKIKQQITLSHCCKEKGGFPRVWQKISALSSVCWLYHFYHQFS